MAINERYTTKHVEELRSNYLQPVGLKDMGSIIDLAIRAFPPKVVDGVVKSLTFHRDSIRVSLDDGRKFFKREEGGRIVGVCGVQRRSEDPPEVCWGSWFFIDPERRGSMLPYRMTKTFLKTVRGLGYKIIYGETSDNRLDYYNISKYLKRYGFVLVASIPDFHEEGVDGQIYKLLL